MDAPQPLLAPRRLYPVVVIGGAASLATEISASRLLAPYFGSSTIVWANIIGLILVYLSVGYWVGGRIADRHANPRSLGALLVGAAACIAALPFIAHPILGVALHGLDALSVGAVIGSFLATLALFSVPVTLLGMVAPFSVRLALTDVREAGTVSGRLYSLSTMGSIAGTFLPAILTIPLIGTQRTMLVAALLLALVAVPLLGLRAATVAAVIAGLLAVPPSAIKATAGLLDERESQYQYVQVVQKDDGRRELQTDEGVSTQSVWRANTVLTGGEWDMFLVAPPLADHPVHRILIIGAAGGTSARSLATLYPRVAIDGVELDPVVSELGREYMGLDRIPGLRTVNEDGRSFLLQSNDRYDLIVIDAYHRDYVPFHLATEEFFQLCRDHLTAGGVLAVNAARVPEDDALASAVAGTVAAVFPQAWTWGALRFNELVIGLDRPLTEAQLRARTAELPAAVSILGPLLARDATVTRPSADPLTDDRAPVEWISDRMYIEHIATGQGLDEQLLPTAP